MEQLLLHLVGDYITQSHWMATRKTVSSWAAFVHATFYSLPFLLIGSWRAFLVIYVTHFFIDRFRLARFVVLVKNCIGSEGWNLEVDTSTGFPSDAPVWLRVWLLIIVDNTIHLCLNYASLRWL